jgi:tetratricopeptide (TPR) repeat protein
VRGALEIGAAVRLAPDNSDLLRIAAEYEARAGQTDSALVHLRRAAQVDPRSVGVAASLAVLLSYAKRTAEATVAADRALKLDRSNLDNLRQAVSARLAIGDLRGAKSVLEASPLDRTRTAVWFAGLEMAWLLEESQREFVLRQTSAAYDNDRTTWGSALARIYWLKGDTTRARLYADSARVAQERLLRTDPDNPDQLQHLATMLALMGRKRDAITKAERALALAVQSHDALLIAYVRERLARVYLLVGADTEALGQLEILLKGPSYLSAGTVMVDPSFAPLRHHAGLTRLLAELEPVRNSGP